MRCPCLLIIQFSALYFSSFFFFITRHPAKPAYAASGRGVGVTYNENFFWFRIDNILHSANMKPINCTVDKVRYSDHYPLWCYLQLKEND